MIKSQKKLRIGSFFINLDSLHFGATQDRFLELSKRVEELTVFYLDGKVKGIFPSNVRFIKIRVPKAPRFVRCLYVALIKSTNIAKKVRKLKIDALYVQSAFWQPNIGLAISKIARRPLIVRLRGDHWAVRRIDLPRLGKYWKVFIPFIRIYDFFQTFTLNHSNHIISVSEFLKKKAIKQGVKREKITTVYTGLNCDFFKPARKRQKKKKFTICSAVRLVRSKGVEYLIKAVKGLDVEVMILGGGEREYIEKIHKMKQENVRFLGLVNYEEMPKYMNYSDILVLPSLSEGLPRTVLEGMACGKPIIATRVSGTPEIGFKGWLVEPGNVEELRKAIMEASKMPKQTLEKMGEENRKIVLKKFSWDVTYEKILRILWIA